MHRWLIAAIATISAVTFTQTASAADLPVKAPVAPVAVAPSWTGWYVGLNVGGNWGTSAISTTVGNSSTGAFYPPNIVSNINAIGAPANLNTNGFTGGLQGGYNYQIGQWLWGVEADFQYFRSAGSNSVTGPIAAFNTVTITSSISSDWLFTLRPRLGIILNNWLFYGTGGLAVSELKANWNWVNTTAGLPITESASASGVKAGWIVGGGIETMLPGKWLIGAEYLYVNFGSISVNSIAIETGFGPLSNPFSHTADLSANIVRARLSKLF